MDTFFFSSNHWTNTFETFEMLLGKKCDKTYLIARCVCLHVEEGS